MNTYASSRVEQALAQKLKRLLQETAGQKASSDFRTCLPQLVHLLMCDKGEPVHQFSQRVHQILADRCQAVTDWDISPVKPDALGEIVRLTVDALVQLRAWIDAEPRPRMPRDASPAGAPFHDMDVRYPVGADQLA